MATREQNLQKLKGVCSITFGNRHIEVLKSKIRELEKMQKKTQEELGNVSKKEILPLEMSFASKNAPVLGAIAGFYVIAQFLFHLNILLCLGIALGGAAVGFVLGIVIKKSAKSSLKDKDKQNRERLQKEIEGYKNRIAEVKQEIFAMQKELKNTQSDVALLKTTYLSDQTLAEFCRRYGMNAVEMLILYFERGRADSIQEAIELYQDEMQDKARIQRAYEEIDRSTIAFMNAYIDAMKVLGRQNEYSYMEKSAQQHNDNLECENKELRKIMDLEGE